MKRRIAVIAVLVLTMVAKAQDFSITNGPSDEARMREALAQAQAQTSQPVVPTWNPAPIVVAPTWTPGVPPPASVFTSAPPTPSVVIDPAHPPTAGDVLTNIPHGVSAVLDFGLNLLPYWDKTATNSFGSELLLYTGPAWKSAIATGATPYVDIGLEYYFAKNFGAGADVVTFGNGQGNSAIDSGHFDLIGRKDVGNVAGLVIIGGGRDFNVNRYDVEAGGGFEFRYKTGIGVRVRTRYLRLFDKLRDISGRSTEHEFLTDVSITLPF